MRFRAYTIINRAVGEGILKDWNRAHKHIDNPTPPSIHDHIESSVMLELAEVLDFEDEDRIAYKEFCEGDD